ncbi:hypothetical protein ACQR1H_04855 [Bradyrhizobium sp. HKCCYLRH2015]|uniref:hypothetical protein n=1 Tax=Bradyrhizobium sp. HKCCYLRH2015 TaxID=3420742 RepID=UPI003EB7CD3B
MAKTFRTTRRKHDNAPFQKATHCIFCGAPQMNGEHIFSRWSHKFLPSRSMKKYDVARVDAKPTQSDRFLIKRTGDIRDWKVQSVCETNCNNGWMRRVENLARPIMIPLIDRDALLRGETTRVLPHQQKIIATWAVLKAMVAEFDAHSWATTHHSQRKYLMKRLTPPAHGWAVWIGAYLRVSWPTHWGSSPFLYLSPKQEARRGANLAATFYNSHSSTQVIGSLFIHVLRSPAHDYIETWKFSPPDGGSIFRIWPPSDVSISWPGTIMTDRDADYVATDLYDDLLRKVAPLIKESIESASTARSGATPFWRWRV